MQDKSLDHDKNSEYAEVKSNKDNGDKRINSEPAQNRSFHDLLLPKFAKKSYLESVIERYSPSKLPQKSEKDSL